MSTTEDRACEQGCNGCDECIDYDDATECERPEFGCCYPGECCMPGLHYIDECHTAEAYEGMGAEEDAAQLRIKVRELELAEEGAKEAFGHVVQDKRDLEAEVRRLQALLDGAHQIIREYATGQRLPNNTDPRP
jgi:hypothetical protein